MGISAGPNGIPDGLVFELDAANQRSYTGTGLTVYDLISGIGGSLVNGATFSQTPSPYFDFDGSNDYITFPKLDALNGKTSFTFSVFCSREGGFFVINQGTSYPESTFLSLYNSTVYFSVSANSGSQAFGYYYNEFNGYRHFVAVFDGTQTGNSNRLKMYENGVLQSISFSSQTIPNITTTTGTEFEIGVIKYLPYYSSSSVSIIQVYNRPLNNVEINQLYNSLRERYNI